MISKEQFDIEIEGIIVNAIRHKVNQNLDESRLISLNKTIVRNLNLNGDAIFLSQYRRKLHRFSTDSLTEKASMVSRNLPASIQDKSNKTSIRIRR